MDNFKENDYIEHWEFGIGKIIQVGSDEVSINFKDKGQISIPKDKITYFKKLNPSGFLAQWFEDTEQIHKLIAEKSPEIIKLLIYDADRVEGRRIKKVQIKPLLTKSKLDDKTWRSRYYFIKDSEWQKWWTSVGKKLKQDPWFDISSKSEIILRDKPVREIESIYEHFKIESIPLKKIIISEQLIKLSDIENDHIIIKDLVNFLTDLLFPGQERKVFNLAIYEALQLHTKGVRVSGFDERAYSLTVDMLLNSGISGQKLLSSYSYFSKMDSQNVRDHLIIFLYGDKNLKEAVTKGFTPKGKLIRLLKEGACDHPLTDYQVMALNSLKTKRAVSLHSDFLKLVESLEDKCIVNFLTDILLACNIDTIIKDAIVSIIIEKRKTSVIYSYLNRVKNCGDDHLKYLNQFLNALGEQSAIQFLQYNLLSEATATERPEIFIAIIKAMLSKGAIHINEKSMHSLIDHSEDMLQSAKNQNLRDLYWVFENIQTDRDAQQEQTEILDTEVLVRIAKSRIKSLDQRDRALQSLIEKGLKYECLNIAQELALRLDEMDYVLLEKIIKAFPDVLFMKDLTAQIIKNLSDYKESSLANIKKILKNPEIMNAFSDVMLFSSILPLPDEGYTRVALFLQDEILFKNHLSRIIEMVLTDQKVPNNTLSLYIPGWSRNIEILLEMIKVFFNEHKSLFNDQLSKSEQLHLEEFYKMNQAHSIEVQDAISKTSQRYEDYLKRLIPFLDTLKAIESNLSEVIQSRDIDHVDSSIIDKVIQMKEELESMLRILKILQRE